jgi:hypothetical protein
LLTSAEWMRRVGYKDAIPEFLDVLGPIAVDGGFTIADLKARFGKSLIDSVIFGDANSGK